MCSSPRRPRSRSARTAPPAGLRSSPPPARPPSAVPARLAVELARGADLGQQRRAVSPSARGSARASRASAGPSASCGSRSSRRWRAGRRPRQVPQQPAVDRAEGELAPPRRARARRGPRRASTRASGPRSRSRAAARPRRAGGRGPPSPASSRTSGAVRVSCQTIALCSGWPLSRSHSTAVSRWLVMPIAATSPAAAPPRRARPRSPPACAARSRARRARPIPHGDGSARARAGPSAAIAPSRSNRITRVLVVPWSIAATKRDMREPYAGGRGHVPGHSTVAGDPEPAVEVC